MSEKVDFVIGEINLSLVGMPEWVRNTLNKALEYDIARLRSFVSEYPLDVETNLTDERIHQVSLALPNLTHLVNRKLYLRSPIQVSWPTLNFYKDSSGAVDAVEIYWIALALLVACKVLTPEKRDSYAASVDQKIIDFVWKSSSLNSSHQLYFLREEDAQHYLADCFPGNMNTDVVRYSSR